MAPGTIAAEKETGWRGSRELWLAAALDALVARGVSAVKVQPLAAQLNLSRTSFYWFFRDRAALLEACLAEWEARTTRPLVDAARARADSPADAVLNVIGCFLHPGRFDPRLEFAVRGWALGDAGVMVRLNAADAERLAALDACLRDHGYRAGEADVRARAIYLTQIGYISMQVREDLGTRLARVADYVAIFSGQPPGAARMARFAEEMRAPVA